MAVSGASSKRGKYDRWLDIGDNREESVLGYKLEGSLLEVCNCEVLCPCWIGEDPDHGTCEASVAYHFDRGMIDGVDVSGLTLGTAAFIPGNILNGNIRECIFIDDRATPEQEAALLSAFRGEKGGPLADLAQLVGEVVEVRRVPITFAVSEGKGTLRIGETVEAEMEPYRSPTGQPTALVDSVFSTIPGSPAFVAKAQKFKMDCPELGLSVDLQHHNAIQGQFRFEA